jgi:NitT/TauT family transport system substrate-binding protein
VTHAATTGGGRQPARVAAAAALALAIAFAAAAGAAEKVRLSFRNEVTSLDFLIAIEEGYFADEGLEVELVPWTGSDEMLPALAQGKVDLGASGPFGPSYANVIQRGGRVRLVRARSVHAVDHCPYAAYVARPELLDSGRLTGIESLRGLRVSTDRTTKSLYFLELLLAPGGLTIDDVKIVEVPAEVRALALERNQIDVVELTEPRIFQAVSSGYGRVWRGINELAPGRQNTFVVFGRRLLDERRDLGVKAMRALSRAVEQYLEQGKSDRNVELIARRTRMDPEAVRQICWPAWSTDGRIDPDALVEFEEWALRRGLIDAIVPPSTLVDESFLPTDP